MEEVILRTQMIRIEYVSRSGLNSLPSQLVINAVHAFEAEDLSRGLPVELEGDRDIGPGPGVPTGVEG
jgi:hypothetical protein